MTPLAPSMTEFAGGVLRVRCLSNRNGREVLLVEDAAGRWRVFKVHRGLKPPDLVRFEAVRQRLAELPRCDHVLPILAFQADRQTGVAWEELALAEGAQPGGLEFDRYAPVQLESGGSPEPAAAIQRTVAVAVAILQALEFFHSNGLVHGDLKPGNILRLNGRWVLADFDTLGATEGVQEITASTEGYQPPGGGTGYDRDTYALGKLLYESWSGRSRLEYPAPPAWVAAGRAWSREDRLLHALLRGLCSPLSGSRLTRMEDIRTVLEALGSGHSAKLAEARKILQPRRRWMGAAGAVFLAALLAGGYWLATRNRWPKMPITRCTLNGVPLSILQHSQPGGWNHGYFRQTPQGIFMFNAQTLLLQPLAAGDRVEIELQKEAWRGHVGALLTGMPFQDQRISFGFRSNFGMVEHLQFFHLDGDSLAAPTCVTNGVAATLGAGCWTELVPTNTLAPYRISLEMKSRQIGWQVFCNELELARGSFPNAFQTLFLSIYGWDNTTYFLKKITVSKGANQSP